MGGTWFFATCLFCFYSHLQRYSSPFALLLQSV